MGLGTFWLSGFTWVCSASKRCQSISKAGMPLATAEPVGMLNGLRQLRLWGFQKKDPAPHPVGLK